MAHDKTNAMRILDRAKVKYTVHTYDASDGGIDGMSIVRKLGEDETQVYKTLVTQGASRDYFVFVIPVAQELDLKAAARAVGEKSVAMIPVKEINRVTGYIRGGCSPVGMKKQFRTVFDSSCGGLPAMFVSGGRIGTQICLAPEDLIRVTGGQTAPITQ